jgi:predicted dehydrogenase
VEDSSAIVMTMPGGAQVLATFGWSSRTWAHEFEVVGTEGKVTWTPADTGPIVTTRGRETFSIDLPNAANVHEPLVADFNAAIASGRSPVCPLTEAVKTNQLLDAIYRSSAEQTVIAF